MGNADVAGTSPVAHLAVHDFWGTPIDASGSHGSYRPLVTLSFRWTAQLAGLDGAYWFHLTNVLLHCAATMAVTISAGRVSGLLFAVHPVHCEAVAGLVGRADVICTLFFLAGLSTWKGRSGLVATLFFTTAAFFSKEYGITLPPVCLLSDLISSRKNRRIQWLILILWTVLLVAFRLWLSDFRTPHFASGDNPVAACPSFTTRTLTFLYLPVNNYNN